MIILQEAISSPDTFQKIIKLLEVTIWPLTVFGGLLLFRKHFSKLIGSLGSIKAGATGIEMNFIEDKLEEATKLIGVGSSGITAKSGGNIIPKSSHAETPYQELLEIQNDITLKIKDLAKQRNIDSSNTSNFALSEKLVDNNVITRQSSRKLKTLLELVNLGLHTPTITQSQVTQIRSLFNNLSL